MGLAVGIDLGTTNTVAGAVRDGVAATIPDPEGQRLIPSTVSFHPSGSVLVGRPALDRRLIDASNTVYSIKRLIGRPWDSPEVQQTRGKLPFELREGPKGGTVVSARGETYSLPEISAFVLRQAKAVAEAALGTPIERAVITVPANFNDLQRAATKMAGRLAGLEVLRILNEPTAAALAYGPQGKGQERVAVYDLGGGTFDVTLLDLAGNVFEVLATAGDTQLGGDDIDVVVADRMADDLLRKHRFDARANPMSYGRLRILGEQIKCALSTHEAYSVEANDLVPGEGGTQVKWSFRMTRPELEWASLALVERTFKVCQQALEAAGVQPGDLDRVILVGGSTRMPMVARKVEQFFGRPPIVRINPDEVVALGAAIQAALLDRSRRDAGQAMVHPRIAEESVVEAFPVEEPASEDMPGLPVVTGAYRRSTDDEATLAGEATPLGTVPSEIVARAAPQKPLQKTHHMGSAPIGRVVTKRMEVEPPREPPMAPPVAPKFEVEKEDVPTAVAPLPQSAPKLTASRTLVIEKEDAPTAIAQSPLAPQAPMRTQRLEVPGPPAPPAAPPAPPKPIVAPPPAPPMTLPKPGTAPFSFDPVPAVAAGLGAQPLGSTMPLTTPAAPAPAHAPPPAPAPPLAPAHAFVPPSAPPPAPRPAPLLIDVTPLSLSVETVGGYCDTLIDANTPVPCDRTRAFSTASDNQTSVNVRVAQGPSKRFAENTYLGEVELSGLTAAPRGETQIAVTFEIDADGILNVRARDVKTGRETAARIQLVGAQTDPREMEAMRARQAAHPLMPLGQ